MQSRYDWQPCLLGRPGIGLCWVEGEQVEPAWPELAERVRAAFDPEGVLV